MDSGSLTIEDLKDAYRISDEIITNAELQPQNGGPLIICAIKILDQGIVEGEDTKAAEGEGEEPTQQPSTEKNTDTTTAAKPKTESRDHLFNKDYIDPRISGLCEPIIRILGSITDLESFAWHHRDGWWDSKGTRPKEFWTALWRHAPTLKSLDLGFYTHEVLKLRAPDVEFPALEHLSIDATTAHGDDGSALDNLLSHSPNVRILTFEYPGCDLDTCQIQNITWNYTFPHLHTLTVNGYDFNPRAYADLLMRHPLVTSLTDLVHAYEDTEPVPLPNSALPNLRVLKTQPGGNRTLSQWFDVDARRPIQHLHINPTFGYQDIKGLATSHAAETLKCLESDGSVIDWRPRSPPEFDSDDSEDEETRVKATQDFEQSEREREGLNFYPKAIKDVSPHLKELRELAVGLESGNISTSNGKGGRDSPPAMTVDDVRIVLSVFPEDGNIRALRVEDGEAEALGEKELVFENEEVPRNLEYLKWDGKEKVLYRLERDGGKVRCVKCEPVRAMGHARRDWTDRRVLDY